MHIHEHTERQHTHMQEHAGTRTQQRRTLRLGAEMRRVGRRRDKRREVAVARLRLAHKKLVRSKLVRLWLVCLLLVCRVHHVLPLAMCLPKPPSVPRSAPTTQPPTHQCTHPPTHTNTRIRPGENTYKYKERRGTADEGCKAARHRRYGSRPYQHSHHIPQAPMCHIPQARSDSTRVSLARRVADWPRAARV